jgi:hypothetical protein
MVNDISTSNKIFILVGRSYLSFFPIYLGLTLLVPDKLFICFLLSFLIFATDATEAIRLERLEKKIKDLEYTISKQK